jgi:hypothetical protein
MKVSQIMNEESRIYVVVAAKVTGVSEVIQPPGRQVAQACHAVSLMRVRRALDIPLPKVKGKVDTTFAIEPITTIVLQARDSSELLHIGNLLTKEDIPFEWFLDTNDDYGRDDDGDLVEVPTAISTYPVEPAAVTGILDYLPLWGK